MSVLHQFENTVRRVELPRDLELGHVAAVDLIQLGVTHAPAVVADAGPVDGLGRRRAPGEESERCEAEAHAGESLAGSSLRRRNTPPSRA